MPIVFVLISTETDAMEDVLQALRDVEGVKEAYTVYGVYDIVAKVEAETMDKLKEMVTWKLRKISKVRTTLTMIVIEGP